MNYGNGAGMSGILDTLDALSTAPRDPAHVAWERAMDDVAQNRSVDPDLPALPRLEDEAVL